MTYAKTVVIDFDGVLHSYTSGWTGPVPADSPNPGALEFVQRLIDHMGLEVVVTSARAVYPAGRLGIIEWLAQHQFPPLRVTSEKVPAIAYVDDRAVPYTGSFEATLQGIEQFVAGGWF